MCFRTANIERGVCRARPGHYYCGSAFKIAEDVLAGKLVLTTSFQVEFGPASLLDIWVTP